MSEPPSHAVDETNLAPNAASAHRVFVAAIAALAAFCAWLIYDAGSHFDAATLYGLIIAALSALPALRWIQKRRPWFPTFEIAMLTCLAFYAVPLLSRHEELRAYTAAVVNEAASYVAFYLLAANAGFAWTAARVRAPQWASESLLPPNAISKVPLGMFLNSIYLYLATFTHLIPFEIEGTLRALFFGLGILSTFILARLWGAHQLDLNGKIAFVANLVAQVIILFSQLYLIKGISLVALALIAFSATRRRIPWIALAVFLPLISLLHLGKPQMRQIYWEQKKPLPGVVELPGFFTEWINHSLTTAGSKDPEEKESSTLLERASLIQMLCLSVERIPEYLPYLGGESYIDIPAQVVPRALWPDKPSSLLANVRLAIYFNLVSPDSAFSVSIAFGVIAEAYANFGAIGVAALGLIFGLALKRVAQLSLQAGQFSALGILMILLTAWSFQIELVLATWLSSLFQAAAACIGLPLAFHRLFRA